MQVDQPVTSAAQRLLGRLCGFSGWLGAILLILMAVMTVVSVIGRAWFDAPIEGDVEMVQLGIAVCIAACMPYAQFNKANIIVDFFTTSVAPSTQARMDAIGAFLYSVVLGVVAWRVAVGGHAAWSNREVSMLLFLPVWVSYAAMVPSLVLACGVGLYQTLVLWRSAHDGEAA